MAESNAVHRFRVPKSGEEESKLLKESVPVYKNKWSAKVFREWQMSRVVQIPVIDSGGVFKDWRITCMKVIPLQQISQAWIPIP